MNSAARSFVQLLLAITLSASVWVVLALAVVTRNPYVAAGTVPAMAGVLGIALRRRG